MVALGKVSWDVAAPIISGDVLYALGSSKGFSTVNAIQALHTTKGADVEKTV